MAVLAVGRPLHVQARVAVHGAVLEAACRVRPPASGLAAAQVRGGHEWPAVGKLPRGPCSGFEWQMKQLDPWGSLVVKNW